VIGVKMQIIRLGDAQVPWSVVLRQLPVPVTERNAKNMIAEAAVYRAEPEDARTLCRNNRRKGASTFNSLPHRQKLAPRVSRGLLCGKSESCAQPATSFPKFSPHRALKRFRRVR